MLAVADSLLARAAATQRDGDGDLLAKWLPEVANILSLRDFPFPLLPRVNEINQKIVEVGVAYMGRDVAELQAAVKYVFNPQENAFYKRANAQHQQHLQQQQQEQQGEKRDGGGEGSRLGLLQANVKHFRHLHGPRAVLTRLFAKVPRKPTTAYAALLLSPFIKIRSWIPPDEMATFLRTATDAVFSLLQVASGGML